MSEPQARPLRGEKQWLACIVDALIFQAISYMGVLAFADLH